MFDGFVLAAALFATAFGAILGGIVFGWDGAIYGAAIMFGIALMATVQFS